MRIKEINEAREKIGGKPYLEGDEKIQQAFKLGGIEACKRLVLDYEKAPNWCLAQICIDGEFRIFNANRTEEKIIEVVNNGISRVLENSWKDLTPITLKFQSREQNPQFAAFVESTDLVIVCSFVMQLPKIDSMSFDLVYPLQTLKPVSSLLRSRVQSDVIETNMNWKDRLENAVLEVPLKVNSKLAEPVVK